jgi:hypothetical protein
MRFSQTATTWMSVQCMTHMPAAHQPIGVPPASGGAPCIQLKSNELESSQISTAYMTRNAGNMYACLISSKVTVHNTPPARQPPATATQSALQLSWHTLDT